MLPWDMKTLIMQFYRTQMFNKVLRHLVNYVHCKPYTINIIRSLYHFFFNWLCFRDIIDIFFLPRALSEYCGHVELIILHLAFHRHPSLGNPHLVDRTRKYFFLHKFFALCVLLKRYKHTEGHKHCTIYMIYH